MIRYNNGVVTAEQLAPYLRTPPPPLPPLSQPAHDESFVLPLLLRFNGQPRVTTNGHIYYTFPVCASSQLLFFLQPGVWQFILLLFCTFRCLGASFVGTVDIPTGSDAPLGGASPLQQSGF